MRTARWLFLVLSAALPGALVGALPAQLSLRELPALARSRAERLRPLQEKALEPFWADLALDYYRDNAQFLDGRIAQAAELGDSVVPLLLEKLQPVANSGPARYLADNCRRVLEHLDPGGFLDALVELAHSQNEVARLEAIQLLGRSRSPRAAPVLARMLAEGRPSETLLVLGALTILKDPAVAGDLLPLLGSSDRAIRSAVLDYLGAAAAPIGLAPALQALGIEADKGLLPKYVRYVAVVAQENDAAARAVLPLLDRERLDWRDTKNLLAALATIAPKGHDPTLRRLHELLDTGETSALGLEAAMTLRALGDKGGLRKLQNSLSDQLKRPQRRQDPQLYEDRGNLFFAMGEYKDAADDFEKVLDLSNSTVLQRKIRQNLVKCEAHRGRWDKVLKHLKDLRDGGASYEDFMAVAQEDQAVQEGLQRPSIRSWLQSLPRDKAGH